MALLQKHKVTPNQSDKTISLLETTGVFGVLNPTGYGASQTPTGAREVADILTSNYYILEKDGTLTFEGGATPVLVGDLYSISYNNTNAQSLANGTPKSFDLNALIGDSYVDGLYKSIYFNWFDGLDVVSSGAAANILSVSDYTEFTNASYISLDGDIYQIVQVNSDNTIVINEEIPEVTDISYEVGYQSTTYFANTYEINKCLRSNIAKLSISNCSCKYKTTTKLYEAVMMYMSIQINIDIGNYQKADEIIQALIIYCNGCNCNC